MSGTGSHYADTCSRYLNLPPNLNIHRYRDFHSDRHRDVHPVRHTDSASAGSSCVDPVH